MRDRPEPVVAHGLHVDAGSDQSGFDIRNLRVGSLDFERDDVRLDRTVDHTDVR